MNSGTFTIQLQDAGKKYLKHWLFRNVSLELNAGDRFAITGLNGSGKSTFLQVLSGYVSLSEGSITARLAGKALERNQLFRHIAVAAPYLDLPEELTLRENIRFYAAHKPLRSHDPVSLAELAGLKDVLDKQVKFFSSGMKQRVRLAFALTADVPFVLLDEPISNLDREGINWFLQLCSQLPAQSLLVICSNHIADETRLCDRNLELSSSRM